MSRLIDCGLIGGTGFGSLLAKRPGRPFFVPTDFGMVKGRIIKHEGCRVFCVERHSRGHRVPPHLVNYLAIGDAMRKLGALACFSTAAVGCLNPDWRVGQLVACEDFLDLTGRNLTRFESVVEHRDFTHPFDPRLNALVCAIAGEKSNPIARGGVYVNTNGPRYETPKEIEMIRLLGGNLVGMTAASEAVSMGEALVSYCCIAVVTNAAAGMEGSNLDHEEVVSVMKAQANALLDILLDASFRFGKL